MGKDNTYQAREHGRDDSVELPIRGRPEQITLSPECYDPIPSSTSGRRSWSTAGSLDKMRLMRLWAVPRDEGPEAVAPALHVSTKSRCRSGRYRERGRDTKDGRSDCVLVWCFVREKLIAGICVAGGETQSARNYAARGVLTHIRSSRGTSPYGYLI
ncbi:hypothetical protein LTR56_016578 [Elasticomyces elasticus]|nr:hypothetical protein LTR56_016578 [Elasticomyces elasticus]KAK3650609.1 hypothetical protein LTR22_012467 [Elasticomyces elasticus]KAK4913942.1 hypothetical protein LTR49_017760 [Elasticomyces elasticus]KAK5753106.1 hypothetical protein LTS12_016785 [Elasticomyces elasticus]